MGYISFWGAPSGLAQTNFILATGRQPGAFSLNSHGQSYATGLPRHTGGDTKGINTANKEKIPNVSLKVRVLKLRFLADPEGPGGFREVWEAGRKHFHLSWYLIVPAEVLCSIESLCT